MTIHQLMCVCVCIHRHEYAWGEKWSMKSALHVSPQVQLSLITQNESESLTEGVA